MAKKYTFAQLNWMEVDERLKSDKRIVIPLGATEEHGYLSLMTDSLFVEHVANAACERADVLLAPVIPFGCSAFAVNFPGTISLRTTTLTGIIEDVTDCLYRQGFRRLIFVTGHGGNEVITGVLTEVQLDRPCLNVYYRDAWLGMKESIGQIERNKGLTKTEHGAWHEVFTFTKTAEIPNEEKKFPLTPDFPEFPINGRTAREYLKDGVVSGRYSLTGEVQMEELLRSSIEALTDFLQTIPPHAAEL